MWNEETSFSALFSAGSWEQAERLAAMRLHEEGDTEEWLVRHALCCMAQGRFAEALQSLDHAVCAWPRSLESLLAGCVVLTDLGFYDEAAKRYDAALAVAAETGAGPAADLETKHRALAEAYAAAGDANGALEQAKMALALSETAEGHLLVAHLLLSRQDPEGALASLEKARRLAPHAPAPHVQAALCYLGLGREAEARESLSRAETLQDRSATGLVLRRALLPPSAQA